MTQQARSTPMKARKHVMSDTIMFNYHSLLGLSSCSDRRAATAWTERQTKAPLQTMTLILRLNLKARN